MNAEAPAFLVELEASGAGTAIRQSIWIYPVANVMHVVGLAVFFAAVVVLDLRLLGAFGATEPADVVPAAQRWAMAGFLVQLASGLVLFTAEASHVALNAVFQWKAALIVVGLLNAIVLGRLALREAYLLSAGVPFSARARFSAALSLSVWLAVAALGRLIAYV